jgi:hypothetical protein
VRVLMPGYDPVVDEVTYNDDYLFGMGVRAARVKRGDLRVYLPSVALVDPWPEEFLWRPVKLLGVVEAWWSMHRSLRVAEALESTYQTADRWQFTQAISRELVADVAVFESFRKHQLRNFLFSYQDALDEKEKTGEFPAAQ